MYVQKQPKFSFLKRFLNFFEHKRKYERYSWYSREKNRFWKRQKRMNVILTCFDDILNQGKARMFCD